MDDTKDTLLIDDFQRGDGQSVFGTRWEGFSDRVMGGLSDLNLAYQRLPDDRLSLRLQGQVRLENNGGFIQARLPLDRAGKRFDASQWDGVRITARAKPGAYYIHLRSRATWLPWQYYGARIPITSSQEWMTMDIPFSAFQGQSTRRALDVSSLKSIGVVAYGEAFEADMEVIELAFYR
ncbi:MAG TPA: CIA30 family protein [Wenzhouxiangella sp.]